MIQKLSFIIVLLFLSISSFAQEKEFTLTGMIGNCQDTTIYLHKISYEGDVLLATTRTKNGEFNLSGKIDQAIAVSLSINKHKKIKFFLSPGFNNILIDKKQFQYKFVNGKVKGSQAQDRYDDYTVKLEANNKAKIKIAEALELPEINTDSVKKEQLKREYRKLNEFRDQYFYKYAKSPVIPFLIYKEYSANKVDVEYIRKSLIYLKQANPKGFYVKELEKRVQMTEILYNTGKPFPNFKGKDLDGKEFDITSTKGKPVLLFIWKAWRPDFNNQRYEPLQEIRAAYPDLTIVNIVRTSSVFKIRDPKTKKITDWHPAKHPELNCIEMECVDAEFPFIHYLKHSAIFYLLDQEGKIQYFHINRNIEKLKTKIETLM